jgi:predicted RNA-binding protein YlqC (UPF0109 family)
MTMLAELVKYLAQSLVTQPEKVSVEEKQDGTVLVLSLSVAAGDMGKIIGRQGKTAKAIRTLTKAVAARENVKVIVEIV